MIEWGENVTKLEKAILVVKDYENIVSLNKKRMLNATLRQGKFLKKFQNSKWSGKIIKELGLSRSTVYFKLNLLKLLDRYPKLKKSSLILNFQKNFFKTIKEVCKENKNEFNLKFR